MSHLEDMHDLTRLLPPFPEISRNRINDTNRIFHQVDLVFDLMTKYTCNHLSVYKSVKLNCRGLDIHVHKM